MTPERWQQVNNLLQETLDRLPAERATFLVEVCSDDKTLRTEVESLISFHERAHGFLETPALEAAAGLLADDQDGSLAGQLIGSYKIERLIGSGGMGQVYLAEDTRLDRKVAIKFLPVELETDELARKRQIREAKAAARLEHPNICAIYEVAEDASRSFIVMQYVEGETLASRIERRAIGLRESLDVVLQIADALSLAHSHGIIHRDIKPQNIIITPRGQVKVLDFGLAKMIRNDGAGASAIARDTPLSSPGMILGTVPYLSPEQAKGAPVDARSDLFSLGVVLYECVAGKSAFAGNTPMEVCAQVIHVDPPSPSTFNRSVPDVLDRIALKALAKEARSRYQSAAEFIDELRTVRDALKPTSTARTRLVATKLRERSRALASITAIGRRTRILVPAIVLALVAASVPLWWRSAPHRPSTEAQYWYDVGSGALHDCTHYKASKAFERAIQIDDGFVLAHARLAEAYTELDYADKANREILRARSLVRDLSPLPSLERLYLEAITHVVLREYGPAIASYREITQQTPYAERSHAQVDLGYTYEKNDEIEKAIESYTEATRLAPSEPAAYLRLGILYGRQRSLSSLENAQEAFRRAEELYQALSNHEGVTEVCYQRGFVFFNLDKLAEARAQLEKALKLTTATASHYQRVRSLLVLSSVLAAGGYADKAEQQATEAIELARTDGIENQATNGLIWLGNAFLLKGDFADAEKHYKQALDLAQKDNGQQNEAMALLQLGSLRSLQRNTDEAKQYIEEALPFLRRAGYRKWLSQALTLLGRTYRDQGDYESALRTFNDELQVGHQAGDQSQVALLNEEIGGVLYRQQLYPEALRYFDVSYEINKSLDAKIYSGYAAMHRGSVLWLMGRYDEASGALEDAFTRAQGSDGSYKQLLAAIRVIDALMELSQWHLKEAQLKSRLALDIAGAEYKASAVQAECALGLSLSRSGKSLSGKLLCEGAVDKAKRTGDPQLISDALLAWAETLLESGQARRARDTALEAELSFARFAQQDSEWRAFLIAARASQRIGEENPAHEYASRAASALSSLEPRWGTEAFNGYAARPDVKRCREQLDSVLKP